MFYSLNLTKGLRMILRVGAFLYRVKFVEGYIDYQGQRCLGLCDNDAHEITVSTVPGLAQQVQVICHEYMEAWLFHFGQGVNGKEDYCDLFGMAMAQFVLDLTHQLHAFASKEGGQQVDLTAIHQMGQQVQDDSDGRQTGATKVAGAGLHAWQLGRRGEARLREPSRSAAVSGKQRDARQGIATKLASQAAKAGLSVARVYDPCG